MASLSVIGAGYVGLTTAACFAHLGHDVRCADIDPSKIALLRDGRIPIYEEHLERIVQEQVSAGRLQFVVGAATGVAGCDFVYLCVPTPQGLDGSADLSYIEDAAREIGPVLERGATVVNKSTVPVGATRHIERAIGRSDVRVVSNPEFLREGTAVSDFLHPDRVVIGADDQAAAARVAALYLSVRAPILITDAASAETIKYASNAYLATKLSFVNAVAAVCEAVGADVGDVMLGIGYDRRIGHDFLKPGPGWGGSCFPKDTRAMLRIAEDGGYDFALLRGVIDVNEQQLDRVADKVTAAAGGDLQRTRICVLGLSFKAGTDDLRESPAVEVTRRLLARGAIVRAYDPAVRAAPLDEIELTTDPYAACEGARVAVVLTEWDEFKWLDFDKVADLMATPSIVDTRNILDRGALIRRGFAYRGIGRA